jgi:hypothetical protein
MNQPLRLGMSLHMAGSKDSKGLIFMLNPFQLPESFILT